MTDSVDDTTFGNFVLGLAGLALLRDWYGADGGNRRSQLIELAESYGSNEVLQFPVPSEEFDAADGYSRWAASYDAPGNPMTAIEQPLMVERAAAQFRPGGVALDAGCGTGRIAAELIGLGFDVIGVDVTAEMLAVAKTSVPDADFRLGAFEDLPLDDASVDVITTGLAVCHASDLDAVFSEFARVLRPGGRMIMSNPHPFTSGSGGQAFFAHDDGMPFVRNHPHQVGDYVTPMIQHGFRITDITDVAYDEAANAANPVSSLWPDVVTGALFGQPFVLIVEAELVS